MNKRALILSTNPPKTYVDALKSLNIPFDCKFLQINPDDYSGLLLIGGGDILPSLYGGDIPFEDCNPVRDGIELDVLDEFVSKNLTVLGVCRGLQVVNVYFGGGLSLCDGHTSSKNDVVHEVVGDFKNFREVNSRHRQCVLPLAPNAEVLLSSPDGVPEAVSFGERILGVQFHPERLNSYAVRSVYGFLFN